MYAEPTTFTGRNGTDTLFVLDFDPYFLGSLESLYLCPLTDTLTTIPGRDLVCSTACTPPLPSASAMVSELYGSAESPLPSRV